MFDYTAPLLVPGRMADRMAEAQARRLAAEARAASTRTHGLAGQLRSALRSSAAFVTRLGHAHVRPGPRLAGPRLATGHDRA